MYIYARHESRSPFAPEKRHENRTRTRDGMTGPRRFLRYSSAVLGGGWIGEDRHHRPSLREYAGRPIEPLYRTLSVIEVESRAALRFGPRKPPTS